MSFAKRPSATTFGFVCLLVTSLGWGLNWPAMKVILAQLPPLFARGTAGSVAGLACALATVLLGQSLVVPRPLIGRVVAAAALNVFAWMGFATVAMRWLSVGQCALLVYTMPVWATLLAWPIRGERPSLRAIAGLALCMAGLWQLFGSGGFHLRVERARLCDGHPGHRVDGDVAHPLEAERDAAVDGGLDDRLGRCLVEVPGPFGLSAVAHHAQADPGDLQSGRSQPYVLHGYSSRCGCSRWRATPSTTRVIPATSWTVGSWRSTITPMTVANTGSSASMRENVARDSRAMASWSVT